MEMAINHKTGSFEPIKHPEFERGQIVWLNGYGQN